jgi:hypothetical protein
MQDVKIVFNMKQDRKGKGSRKRDRKKERERGGGEEVQSRKKRGRRRPTTSPGRMLRERSREEARRLHRSKVCDQV